VRGELLVRTDAARLRVGGTEACRVRVSVIKPYQICAR